ncbi:MAG: SDR family oxidoreductase [Planctomycetota bacterium]|nr:SDR family oxidoreductase [Planctomycetota bacterium]
MLSLQEHSAFITGSSQGIGLAIANSIAAAGGRICLHGLQQDSKSDAARQQVADLSDHPVDYVAGDLADSSIDCVEKVFLEAIGKNPEIDLLVNNAGTYMDQPFLEMDYETFDRTMRLNVYAYFFMTQKFARYWAENGIQGRVLLIGSINGRLAEPDHSAYDTSKGAIEMMVKTLCVSLASHQIRVNGLAPGLFKTPLTAGALADQQLLDWMKLHTPNGQVPGPQACGEAAVYLLSDEAWHVNGQMLLVDGGMSAWQQPDPP